MAFASECAPLLPGSMRAGLEAWLFRMLGYVVLALWAASAVSLLTWSFADPSFTHATNSSTRNLLGPIGAIFSDLIMQLLGLAGVFALLPPMFWGLQLVTMRRLDGVRAKLVLAPIAVVLLACAASSLPKFGAWPLPYSLGGVLGDQVLRALTGLLAVVRPERASAAAGLFCCAGGLMLLMTSLGLSQRDLKLIYHRPRHLDRSAPSRVRQRLGNIAERAEGVRREPVLPMPMLPATAHSRPARPDGRSARLEEEPPVGEFPVDDDDGDADGARRMAEIFAPEVRALAPDRSETAGLVLPVCTTGELHASGSGDPIGTAKAVTSQDASARSPRRWRQSARAPAEGRLGP